MKTGWLLCLLVAALVFQNGEALLCHRCYSAFGGCSEHVSIWMFPWRYCGSSNFCVKVITKVPGQDPKILRECESVLMQSTQHRLAMPNLRRHNYCLPARKNDPYNPLVQTDSTTTYCFCNEYPGCNNADNLKIKFIPAVLFSSLVTIIVSKLF